MSKKYYAAVAKKKRRQQKARIDALKTKLDDSSLDDEERLKLIKKIEKLKRPTQRQKKSQSVWTVSEGLPSLGKKN